MKQYVISSKGYRLTEKALDVTEATEFKRAMEVVEATLDERDNPLLGWDFENEVEDSDRVHLTWGELSAFLQEIEARYDQLVNVKSMENRTVYYNSAMENLREFSIEVQVNTERNS